MTIRPSVLDQWVPFSVTFESFLDFLYLDDEGLVTIGMGLLVDPQKYLAGIDFVFPATGKPAGPADVAAAWLKVKGLQKLAKGGGAAFASFTTIRATADSLTRAAQRKLAADVALLLPFFPAFAAFPAAGQLLILSMAWAMGPEEFAKWPHFCAAVNAGDWAAVAVPHGAPASCEMSEVGENASFHLRNLANLELAKAAAIAVEHELLDDLDVASIIAAARAYSAQTPVPGLT